MGIYALIAVTLVAASPVVHPDWVRKPSAEEVKEAFPPLAQMLGIPGSALLSCSITAKGRTRSCEVINESPAGLGFGAAALAMSSTFEVSPLTVSGLPVDGGKARLPIRFALPEDEPLAKPTARPMPSAEAMALARKILAVTSSEAQVSEAVNQSLVSLEARQDPGVDPAVKAKALRTYRETIEEMTAEMMDASAASYARTFKTAQLADILAFYASPTGQAFVRQQSQLAREGREANLGFERTFSDRWRAKFCRQASCPRAKP